MCCCCSCYFLLLFLRHPHAAHLHTRSSSIVHIRRYHISRIPRTEEEGNTSKKETNRSKRRERKRQKTQFECFFKNSNKNEQVLCFRENKTISFFFHHLKTTSQLFFFSKLFFFVFYFQFFFCGKKKNVEKCNSNSKKKRNMKEGTVQYNSKKKKTQKFIYRFLHIFHQPNQKGVWRAFKRG